MAGSVSSSLMIATTAGASLGVVTVTGDVTVGEVSPSTGRSPEAAALAATEASLAAAAAAAGDSGPGTTEAAAGTENSGQWQRAGSAFLQQAQRAAVAAVVGGVARSTVARIPIVGADCMLTEKKPKQSKLCTVFSFLDAKKE